MQTLEYNVLRVLAYFDIFNYPLLFDEIKWFLIQEADNQSLALVLQNLELRGKAFKIDNYYSLRNEHALVERRKDGNKRAERLMPKARKIAKLLYYFPFVRAIGISGSLSKNFAAKDSDFDYFIITQENRLWIARFLLGMLKKASFLVRRPQWFCINYYIDESCLKIPENNIFTATELFTLVAAEGADVLNTFFQENNWVNSYYPLYKNKKINTDSNPESPSFFIKRSIEWLLNNTLGNKIDNWILNRLALRWQKKKQAGTLINLQGKAIELPLCSKNYCKHNPKYFQAKVLNEFQQRLPKFDHELVVTTLSFEMK